MKLKPFLQFSILTTCLLLTLSCALFQKTPKDNSGFPEPETTINLDTRLAPNSISIDHSADLKIIFKNLNADTIIFPRHTRFIFRIPVGPDSSDVVDLANWNNNLSVSSSQAAWAAQKSQSTNGLVTFALGINDYSLAPKDSLYITFKSVKATKVGNAKIGLTYSNNSISIPADVTLNKMVGAIDMIFTAGPNTIITATEKVKFNWAVKNAEVLTFNGRSVPFSGDTTLNFITANLGTHTYLLKANSSGVTKEDTILVYLKKNNDTGKTANSTPVNIWSSDSSIFRITNTAQQFEFSNNGITGWKDKSKAPPEEMASSPAVYYQGVSYLIGGSRIAPNLFSNKIYAFKDGDWSALPTTIPGPKRMGHAALIFNEKLYVIGGFNEYGNPMSDVHIWDWGSAWTSVSSNNLSPENARGVFISGVRGDSIWIGGGFSSFSGKPLNNFLAFDGSKWHTLNFDSPPINLCAGSFQSANGNFYIITTEFSSQGGFVDQKTRTGANYIGKISEIILSQANNKWSLLNPQIYGGSIPSQCFDINTTFFNGALWIKSMNYDKSGMGFWYFIP